MAVLEAWCNGDPTAFQWTNCASATRICKVRGGPAGVQTYQMVAVNAGGSSVPVTANVNWTATPLPPPGFCAQAPSLLFSEVGSDHETVHSAYAESPGFAWNGAWVVRFTVPATAHAGQTGFGIVAEYDGPPTFRELTITTTACDFRPDRPDRRQRSARPQPRADAVDPVRHRGVHAGHPRPDPRRHLLPQRPEPLRRRHRIVSGGPGALRRVGGGPPAAVILRGQAALATPAGRAPSFPAPGVRMRRNA